MEQKIEQKEFKICDFTDKELKNMSGIYQIRNIVNNHFYIGSAVDLLRRKTRHFQQLRDLKHINSKLSDATVEFGLYNFVFEVIELCEKNECLKIEQNWLNKYFGEPYFYNKNPKASGIEFTDEIRQKMSENHADVSGKNNYFYDKQFIGEDNHFFGKHHTEESKLKMSLSHKGKSNKKIKVIDLKTGKIYDNKKQCCRENNIKYKSFHLQDRFIKYDDYIK